MCRADAYDDIDAIGDHTGRNHWQLLQIDVVWVDVGQLATFDIEEVVVRLGVAVVVDPRRVDDQLAQEAPFGKEAEGVVDGRLGDVALGAAVDPLEYLVRAEVLVVGEENQADLNAWASRGDDMAAQQVGNALMV